jgi:hypothetical protein
MRATRKKSLPEISLWKFLFGDSGIARCQFLLALCVRGECRRVSVHLFSSPVVPSSLFCLVCWFAPPPSGPARSSRHCTASRRIEGKGREGRRGGQDRTREPVQQQRHSPHVPLASSGTALVGCARLLLFPVRATGIRVCAPLGLLQRPRAPPPRAAPMKTEPSASSSSDGRTARPSTTHIEGKIVKDSG